MNTLLLILLSLILLNQSVDAFRYRWFNIPRPFSKTKWHLGNDVEPILCQLSSNPKALDKFTNLQLKLYSIKKRRSIKIQKFKISPILHPQAGSKKTRIIGQTKNGIARCYKFQFKIPADISTSRAYGLIFRRSSSFRMYLTAPILRIRKAPTINNDEKINDVDDYDNNSSSLENLDVTNTDDKSFKSDNKVQEKFRLLHTERLDIVSETSDDTEDFALLPSEIKVPESPTTSELEFNRISEHDDDQKAETETEVKNEDAVSPVISFGRIGRRSSSFGDLRSVEEEDYDFQTNLAVSKSLPSSLLRSYDTEQQSPHVQPSKSLSTSLPPIDWWNFDPFSPTRNPEVKLDSTTERSAFDLAVQDFKLAQSKNVVDDVLTSPMNRIKYEKEEHITPNGAPEANLSIYTPDINGKRR